MFQHLYCRTDVFLFFIIFLTFFDINHTENVQMYEKGNNHIRISNNTFNSFYRRKLKQT